MYPTCEKRFAYRQVSMKFEDMIDRLEMPLVLIYGKEDPWVVPLWGHRIKRQRPDTLYYEVTKAIIITLPQKAWPSYFSNIHSGIIHSSAVQKMRVDSFVVFLSFFFIPFTS